jgi:hypothetical protein
MEKHGITYACYMDSLIEMILIKKHKEANKEYNKSNIKIFYMMILI